MKKKLNLLGVLVVSFLFCLVGVKADYAQVTWPTWTTSEGVLYDIVNQRVCYSQGGNCKLYTITQDLGEGAETFTVTDGTSDYTLNKYLFVSNYAQISTKKDVQCIQECGDGDFTQDDGFVQRRYYKNYESLSSIISDASQWSDKYINIYMNNVTESANIPNNVTVAAKSVETGNLKIDGFLTTGFLRVNNVIGSGEIELDYRPFIGDPYVPSDRLSINSIEGVEFNITGTQIKEGLLVGDYGYVDSTSKDNVQKTIDQINRVKGSALDGYKLVLKETSIAEIDPNLEEFDRGNFYVGVLVKEEIEEKSTTTTVANPKTSDGIVNIIAIMSLASIGVFLAIKKVKNN